MNPTSTLPEEGLEGPRPMAAVSPACSPRRPSTGR